MADETNAKQYSWLSDTARDYVERGATERIAFIRAEHFVVHPQMQRALIAMDYIFTQPRKRRMECLHIGGPSGTGKTILTKHFLRRNNIPTEQDGFNVRTRNGIASVITADLSGIASESDFYRCIADGCIDRDNTALRYSADGLFRIIKNRGSHLLLIDEADRIAELPKVPQRDILAQIKRLTNTFEMGLVLLGTRKLDALLNSEDTLRHRFIPDVQLTPLSDLGQLRAFVVNLAKRMPLRSAPTIDNAKCIRVIFENTGGRQPNVSGLIRRAAIHALVQGGESLNSEVLSAGIADPYLHAAPGGIDE
ncbi:TniB family NTP-binding protein [Solimonas marina]|uniref:AAA family ATPase n=1 Tax=Solimonas marina TaxID=2714601 RepID=A0A970BAG4_9GAMM|nr:TniB family NTP-binding protein [Solimonas marina]NKF24384.1 AAA family ATPase [Solimonas marina]